MSTIDYYYTSSSPYAYLGHDAVLDVARRHGARLAVKPVNLGAVFEVSGALPLAQRPAVRQRYRLVELQRMAEWRGKPINLKPRFFPTDATLADCSTIAIIENGGDPTGFMRRIFSAVWVENAEIADEAVVAERLAAEGFDAGQLIEMARDETVAAIHAANSQAAIDANIVGAPGFVLNGEPFWGQDRIEFLDRALASGRAPFRP